VLFLLNVIIGFVLTGFGAEKDRRDALLAAGKRAAKAKAEGEPEEALRSSRTADWRLYLLGHPFPGWLLMRPHVFTDVYDSLYLADITAAYPETLAPGEEK